MNFAKKSFTKKHLFLLLILAIIVVVIMFVILQNRNSKKVTFLIFQENYSFVLGGNEQISFQINCNRDDTMYFNPKYLEKISLVDYDSEDIINVNLNSINKIKKEIEYEEEKYYGYKLIIDLPFSSTEIIKYQNFYLKLEYINDEEVCLPMGSLALVAKDLSGEDLVITSLQGIVNRQGDYQTLVGVMIKLSSTSDVKILDIKAISSVVNLNLGETIETDEDTKNNDDLSTILNKEYDIYSNKLVDKLINPLELKKRYLIPLSYSSYEQVRTLSFIIKYMKNDIIFEQAIEAFPFFSERRMIAKKVVYD